ncbi:MAG: hypothetical protein KDA24_22020 [Deltaproteobacteria bacterium]|nr:hypothetical protein [Deltaproteobacteria bacterium]
MSAEPLFRDFWYPVLPSTSLTSGESQSLTVRGSAHRLSRVGGAAILSEAGESTATCEVNGLVFAWSGSGEPDWQVHPLPEFDDPSWTPLTWRRLGPYAATARDVMRDVVDNGHFEPVHGLMGAATSAWEEGPHLRTVSQGKVGIPRRYPSLVRRGLTPRGHLRLEGRIHGPCLLSYRGTLSFGIHLEHILLSAVVPIDEATVEIWIGVSIQRQPLLPNWIVQRRIMDDLQSDYDKDAALWKLCQDNAAAGGVPAPAQRPVLEEEARLFSVFDDWWGSFHPEPGSPPGDGVGRVKSPPRPRATARTSAPRAGPE